MLFYSILTTGVRCNDCRKANITTDAPASKMREKSEVKQDQ